MSKPKGSNKIAYAKKVIRSALLYSKGFQVVYIAKDLGVSQRMVYYYLTDWLTNNSYFISLAKEAGFFISVTKD